MLGRGRANSGEVGRAPRDSGWGSGGGTIWQGNIYRYCIPSCINLGIAPFAMMSWSLALLFAALLLSEAMILRHNVPATFPAVGHRHAHPPRAVVSDRPFDTATAIQLAAFAFESYGAAAEYGELSPGLGDEGPHKVQWVKDWEIIRTSFTRNLLCITGIDLKLPRVMKPSEVTIVFGSPPMSGLKRNPLRVQTKSESVVDKTRTAVGKTQAFTDSAGRNPDPDKASTEVSGNFLRNNLTWTFDQAHSVPLRAWVDSVEVFLYEGPRVDERYLLTKKVLSLRELESTKMTSTIWGEPMALEFGFLKGGSLTLRADVVRLARPPAKVRAFMEARLAALLAEKSITLAARNKLAFSYRRLSAVQTRLINATRRRPFGGVISSLVPATWLAPLRRGPALDDANYANSSVEYTLGGCDWLGLIDRCKVGAKGSKLSGGIGGSVRDYEAIFQGEAVEYGLEYALWRNDRTRTLIIGFKGTDPSKLGNLAIDISSEGGQLAHACTPVLPSRSRLVRRHTNQ